MNGNERSRESGAGAPALDRRGAWRLGVLVALLAAVCLWVSFQFLEPMPPRAIALRASRPTAP